MREVRNPLGHLCLVVMVVVVPASQRVRLTHSFDRVRLQALGECFVRAAVTRPRAQHVVQQKQASGGVRRRGEREHVVDELAEFARHLRDLDHAGASVFAAFRVVRGQCCHGARPQPAALVLQEVEFSLADAESPGCAADFLQCYQTARAVEQGVFHPFGHHRSADLGEAVGRLAVRGQGSRDKVERRRVKPDWALGQFRNQRRGHSR